MSYSFQPLTKAERRVLVLLVDGGTNKSIAEVLGCSEFTVKNHVGSIIEKLYASNRAHAAALAVKLNLAEPNTQIPEHYFDTSSADNTKYGKAVEDQGEIWGDKTPSGWTRLTTREKGICLLLAASGKSSRELADELKITRTTFRTHRRHIFQKLQVADRSDLAHVVSQAGGNPYLVIIK